MRGCASVPRTVIGVRSDNGEKSLGLDVATNASDSSFRFNSPARRNVLSALSITPRSVRTMATGELADDREPLAKVAAVVAATARAGDGRPVLPRMAVYAIGSVAN